MNGFMKRALLALLFTSVFASLVACGSKPSDLSDNGNVNIHKITADVPFDIEKLNADLVKKPLPGIKNSQEIGVIIEMREGESLTATFNNTKHGYHSLNEYVTSKEGLNKAVSLKDKQSALIKTLEKDKVIKSANQQYATVLNGVYVRMTYGNLSRLLNYSEVGKITISQTYAEPDVAVTNYVNVYGTGIFDSSNVPYTGKNCVVAVLDSGFDYTHSAYSTMPADPLLNETDIDAHLTSYTAYKLNQEELISQDLYINAKVPFAYDYADKDANVLPYDSEHGTHVAAIIGGKDDVITGVAVDTQLALMKVFSDYRSGAETGDILAALEDAIILNVDCINMSLGSSVGFAREVDEEYTNTVYDSIGNAGISLIVAASNDYSSGYGSDIHGNLNLATNPDSGTVGSPASYSPALSVASINGQLESYFLANGQEIVFFLESNTLSGKENNFYDKLYSSLGLSENEDHEFEYVTIPGIGLEANYIMQDVRGKIALVKRGIISFEEKMQNAYNAGAVACIIYNNISGDISMSVGNNILIPTASISQVQGEELAKKEKGKLVLSNKFVAGPFMSDFSSWGPIPSLELKPEITAHGGNITSAVLSGGYDTISGTSMAAPNMAGVALLVRQYVKDKFPSLNAIEVTSLVNQLIMSTATIALNHEGNAYSPRKQGAGLADVVKATTTDAYAYIENKSKTKIELFDDKEQKGVYDLEFNVKNISNKSLTYDLSALVMTEGIMGEEGKKTVTEKSIYLNPNIQILSTSQGTLSGSKVTLPAQADAKIKMRVTLSNYDKYYLRTNFPNGMYVEGFVTIDNADEAGVDLNIPFLAFFGDWSKAPIFDKTFYEVESEAYNGGIDPEDKLQADYFATTPYGQYMDEYIIPLGSYIYNIDESKYEMIPATIDKIAMGYDYYTVHGIYAIYAGLLRGAKQVDIVIKDTATGAIIYEHTEYNVRKAHFEGVQYPGFIELKLDPKDLNLSNNTEYEFAMTAHLDYDATTENVRDTFNMSIFIDYEPPRVENATFHQEFNRAEQKWHTYMTLDLYDNHYTMALRPGILTKSTDPSSSDKFTELEDFAIPVNGKKGEVSQVVLDITHYLDRIYASDFPNTLAIYVDDYALNASVFAVYLPNSINGSLGVGASNYDVDSGQALDLKQYVTDVEVLPVYYAGKELTGVDLTNFLKTATPQPTYLEGLVWSSSNTDIVTVIGGVVRGLKAGTATITATKPTDARIFGSAKTNSLTFKITVSGTVHSENEINVSDIYFGSYETLFAFPEGDGYSDIGGIGDVRMFSSSAALSLFPSEKVSLFPVIQPLELDTNRYRLEYSSSNKKILEVDENGVVRALAEGNASITLKIFIDGKESFQTARCSVTIKSPFVMQGRILIEYKGFGGTVVVPDDLGIYMINSYAFSLSRDRYIHPEDDNPEVLDPLLDPEDFDARKLALGNDTITKIIIPDGVEIIEKYAFYNLSKLEEVVLGKDVKQLGAMAFYKCVSLKDINLKDVRVVGFKAFEDCVSLKNIDTSGISTIGYYAFYNCINLAKADLSSLRSAGEYAFGKTTALKEVVIGPLTQLGEGMFKQSGLQKVDIYTNKVEASAFEDCLSLREVTFHNDLLYIGARAFYASPGLNKVTFEGTCKNIYAEAFAGCYNLQSFKLPEGEVNVHSSIFANSSITSLQLGRTTVIAPNAQKVLSGAAITGFNADDSDIYTVNSTKNLLIDGQNYIVLAAFNYNYGDYVIPSNIDGISSYAFSGVQKLTKLTLNDGLVVKMGAFANCTNLTEVVFGEVTLEDHAFAGCSQLSLLTDLTKVEEIPAYAFANTAVTSVTYNNNIGDYAFANSLVGTLTMTEQASIGKYAFANSRLATINITATITIDDYAFANSLLKTIDLSKVSRFGKYALANTKLVDVVLDIAEIPEGLLANTLTLTTLDTTALVIGDYAFMGASNLANVSAMNVEEIGNEAFKGCKKLKQFDGIDNAGRIGNSAFYEALILNFTTINATHVGEYAFAYTGCVNVTLNNIEELGIYAFANSALQSVVISSELEVLEEGVFANSKLASINTSNIVVLEDYALFATLVDALVLTKVTHIGDYALAKTKLSSNLSLPEIVSIGEAGLSNTALVTITLGDQIKHVGALAFTSNALLVAITTASNESFLSDSGVLYAKTINKHYELIAYPSAKSDSSYTVIDDTVRIAFGAAMDNLHLVNLTLPYSLISIGDYAFKGCEKLSEVVFKGFIAPRLEGTKQEDLFDFYSTLNEIKNAFDVDKLFSSAMYIDFLYYRNFTDYIGMRKLNINMVYPENGIGYDSLLYSIYFQSAATSNKAMNSDAWWFIDNIRFIDEPIDKYSASLDTLIMDLKRVYNSLRYSVAADSGFHFSFITDAHLAKLERLETQINSLRPEPKPQLLAPSDFAVKNYVVGFSEVSNATGYVIRFRVEEETTFYEIQDGDNISKLIPEGEVYVAIAAMGSYDYIDSDFFELSNSFTRPAEPGFDGTLIYIISGVLCGITALGLTAAFILRRRKGGVNCAKS